MKRIWLRTARENKGLTQAQLAERIGKPQSYISRLETTKNDPTITEVEQLARELDVEPFALKFGAKVQSAVNA